MALNGHAPKKGDINTRKLTVTIIADHTGAAMKLVSDTLPELREQILFDNKTKNKSGLVWIKGAIFGKLKSKRGSYRHNANVTAITAVIVEHDKGTISFDKAIAILKKAKLRWLAYTSPSYVKNEKEKWRLLLPLSCHRRPKHHTLLVAMLNGLFGGKLAEESFTLSQAYYFGPVNSNPDHRCEIGDGDFLDLRIRDLFKQRIYKGGSKKTPKPRQRKSRLLERNVYQMMNTADMDEVRFALSNVDADEYPIWMKVGAALADEYGEKGRDPFHEYSATSSKYQEEHCDVKFNDFAEITEFHIATVFFLADEANPNWRAEYKASLQSSANNGAADDDVKYIKSPSIIIQRADLIVMRPKQWLWRGHLLLGAQQMLSGQPGLAKSQVQIDWMARATTGREWPDGAAGSEPMNVMMLTAEDALDQEVIPRLHAAKADLSRVHIIKCIRKDNKDRQFLLGEDLERLKEPMHDIGNVGLVTIDPITAYMGGKIDSYKTTDVRSQLGPLKDFAEQMNVVVSTITHPPKGSGQKAIDSFIGSQAFIAVCRIGHLSIEEIEVEDGEKIPTGRILFCNVKNNTARKSATLAYHVEEVELPNPLNLYDTITAPRVVWDGAVNVSADDALAAHGGTRGRKSEVQDAAKNLLREMLANGPVAKSKIDAAAASHDFTEKQMRTAREKLEVEVVKEGKGGWSWKLPEKKKPAPLKPPPKRPTK